jgi:uncharacterized protein YjbI with pentapeptide repeats
MTVEELIERYAKGERDFSSANLDGADLGGANLGYADLDFSAWPLQCGSLDVKTDRRFAARLAYHFCRLACGDPEYASARNALAPFANTFHRADERGKISLIEGGGAKHAGD